MAHVLSMIPPSFWGTLIRSDKPSHYRNVPLKHPTVLCTTSMDWALTPPKAALFLLDSSGYWNVLKVKLKSAFLKMLSLDLTSLLQHPHKSISFKYLKTVFSSILVFSVIHSKNFDRASIVCQRERGTRNGPLPSSSWQTEVGERDVWTGSFLDNLTRAPGEWHTDHHGRPGEEQWLQTWDLQQGLRRGEPWAGPGETSMSWPGGEGALWRPHEEDAVWTDGWLSGNMKPAQRGEGTHREACS